MFLHVTFFYLVSWNQLITSVCGHTVVYPTSSLLMGNLSCYKLTAVNSDELKALYPGFFLFLPLNHWSGFLEVRFLGQKRKECIISIYIAISLHGGMYHFTFPLTGYENVHFPTDLPTDCIA